MISVYKVLGQSSPAATTNTSLYTVPASTQTIVSTITVCNRVSANASFRIAVRGGGATLANNHYLYYDTAINGNETISLTLGLTLNESDIITIYSSSGNLTFNAFGTEISP